MRVRDVTVGFLVAAFDPGIAAVLILGGTRQALIEVLSRRERPEPAAVADQLWRLVVAAVRCRVDPEEVAA